MSELLLTLALATNIYMDKCPTLSEYNADERIPANEKQGHQSVRWKNIRTTKDVVMLGKVLSKQIHTCSVLRRKGC